MFTNSDMTPGMMMVTQEGTEAFFAELARADGQTAWVLISVLLSGAEFAPPVADQINRILLTTLTEGPEAAINHVLAEAVAAGIPLIR